MSWELRVWTPNRAELKATYTPTNPGGIADGFRWSVRGDGNSEQMRFQAKPAEVDIAARDIVQLLVDGQPAFYGYIETAWPPDDGEKREYVAVGAAELLRQRLMDEKTYAEQDVAAIVRDIVDRLRHPAIMYDEARVRDTGGVIELKEGTLVPVYNVIGDLANAVGGTTWGVGSDGTFFFNEPGHTATAGYEIQGLDWLPVEGEEVVTKVCLVNTLSNLEERHGSYDYRPTFAFGASNLVIYQYEAPEHDLYGAEKAYVYNGRLLRLTTPDDVDALTSTNLGDPNKAVDCNDITYASSDTDGSVILRAKLKRVAYGVLALVDIKDVSNYPSIMIGVYHYDASGTLTGYYSKGTGIISSAGKYPLMYYFPIPNRTAYSEVKAYIYYAAAADAIRVHRLCGLVMDDLSAYASSLIRLPYQSPAEVEWQGYQPPARYLTVIGAPGGELTGEVDTWEYELYPRRIRTVARLGSRGTDPTARAIRILADQRQAEAQTTAVVLTRR